MKNNQDKKKTGIIAIEIMTIFYNNFGYLFAKISVHKLTYV